MNCVFDITQRTQFSGASVKPARAVTMVRVATDARGVNRVSIAPSARSRERASERAWCERRLTNARGIFDDEQPVAQRRGDLCVRAARVAGVEIPNNKRCETALTYVYGIGETSAKAIMAATGLENKCLREFSEQELTQLREEVEKYQIEGELRRFITMNIKRLKEIQCHRGKMHIRNLPVRGQRTKTNARTRKGKVKTVAGKKK